jgi:type II secretory pathway pseudopilin PulG
MYVGSGGLPVTNERSCCYRTSPGGVLRVERRGRRGDACHRGLTLVELLAVTAVIMLFACVLLPSVNMARKQARTTLCYVRLGELTRAVLLYAHDNGDLPPFIGRGWENLNSGDDVEWPPGSGITVGQLKQLETWCVNHPELTWFSREEDWPADVGVAYGSLFKYARFEDLYRCPEFQRAPEAEKAQSAFNYTRSVLGRKWYVGQVDPEAKDASSPFGAPGPILQVSEIYSPAKMWMLVDEWWPRHCAVSPEEALLGTDTTITGGWMGVDCMNFYLGDELGRYHGSPLNGLSSHGEPVAVRRGGVSHYDGHVELYRDMLPGRKLDFLVGTDSVQALLNFLVDHLFAQRGVTIDVSKIDVNGNGF